MIPHTNNIADLKLVLQSPDLAKVKEELSRLQKRLKAGTKLVKDKQKLQREQSQLSAKLQTDLENVTDGKACCRAHTWSRILAGWSPKCGGSTSG